MQRGSTVKSLLLTLIKCYRTMLSGLLGPRCRFYPTCSQYAIDVIETHGVIRGVGLTVRRICKCHPFHPGGFDPAPGKPEEGR